MNVLRETILTALFTKLQTVQFARSVGGHGNFASASRRLKLWADVPKSQRPALFMTDHREQPIFPSETLPSKSILSVDLWVYIDSSDRHCVPSSDLNIILDAIDTVLRPSPAEGGRQTLGGLVSHCRIDGQIMKDSGDLDGDGLLMVPLKVLAI